MVYHAKKILFFCNEPDISRRGKSNAKNSSRRTRKRAPGKENMKKASSEKGRETEAEEGRSNVVKEQCKIRLLDREGETSSPVIPRQRTTERGKVRISQSVRTG